MTKNYTEIVTPMGDTIIQYEENGFLYSIPKDPANADYQRYLNPEAVEVPTTFN